MDFSLVGVDTETTGLDVWHGDRPFAVSAADQWGESMYWEAPVDPLTRAVHWEKRTLDDVRAFLSECRELAFFNRKFDQRMLYAIGVDLPAVPAHEVFFRAHACNSAEPSFGLKFLAYKYGKNLFPIDDEADLMEAVKVARRIAKARGWWLARKFNHLPPTKKNKAGKEQAKADMWMVRLLAESGDLPPENAGLCERYARRDALRTIYLELFYRGLMDQPGERWAAARDTYRREMELWPVVYEMEQRGVALRIDAIEAEAKTARLTMAAEEQLMRRMVTVPDPVYWEANRAYRKHYVAGSLKTAEGKAVSKIFKMLDKIRFDGFNPGSNDQLKYYLYCLKGLPVTKRTPKGNPSTNWEVLTQYGDDPVIASLLRWKSAEKNEGSFLSNYLGLKTPDPAGGWRLHPDIRQIGPRTGRFAMAKPNLQNVADGAEAQSRGQVPFTARIAFGPRPGTVWYHFDYSGLQARLFADESGEPLMVEAFRKGRDLHEDTCNMVWGGEGNPRAVMAARQSLYLTGQGQTPPGPVVDVWGRYAFAGLKELPDVRRGVPLSGRALADADRVAAEWLADHNWEIVAAEGTLHVSADFPHGDKKSSAWRIRAKKLFFLKIFGGGVPGAMKQIRCSKAEAKDFLRQFDRNFPAMYRYIRKAERTGLEQGYVINRLYRPIAIDPDYAYKACNYLIQSYEADLIKRAMLRLWRWLKSTGAEAELILTIHDELVLEVRRGQNTIPFLRAVKSILEDNPECTLGTPVGVDRTAVSWDQKAKVRIPAAPSAA